MVMMPPCFRITDAQENLFYGNMIEGEPNPVNETSVSFCLCDGSRECGRKAVSDTIADASEPQHSVRLGVPRAPVRRKRSTDSEDVAEQGDTNVRIYREDDP